MKALILAGGAGTRLRPITHTRAKQLVPVANKPILHYGIDAMVAAGIEEIGVIVGDTRAEVTSNLGDGTQFGASITYIPQDAPLGLAHCVLIAREFLGDDDFVMYLGDNLLEQDLAAFVRAFEAARAGEEPPAAQILLKQVPDPHRFGIATLDESGGVVALVEKPEDPPSDLALVGVYLFTSRVHDAVAAIEPSPRGELEITDAIQWLLDRGERVRCELLSGWWIDTGKLTPLLEANRLLLEKIETHIEGSIDDASSIEGRVVIGAGTEIVNSTIRGPVAIGAGSRIVDSFVGPFSAIGNDCEVRHSEIEHSVVMDDSSITDIPRLEDSLIGSDARVARSRQKPRALRLMVGDHCQIDVE
ncbi:MAG: glucose-1-phosphate thymidylyltransferase [Ilumatobacter sp.]|uniref:glucose-1-phosphate thymidylyltransferase n=1 Tax=Ilumatobacter sp. TaxID=1967498 RepID=UPI00260EFC96|nr:glucose-1-phosphate thymidylyltransferase [Ilumatobacter sp.]MDJ0768083.1 glucose-1-phosphate thymidylyltransferase [Ilumatobacter sp.]